jgi:peptidoglycan/xylan/chitin deacetylase (PgdA/CDA1 family)
MPLKRDIRRLMDRAAVATGIIARRERTLRGQLTILMYHRVLPDNLWQGAPLPGLVMPLSCFEAQVKHLAKNFEIVTVTKGLNRLRVEARDEKPLLAITFDDGYDDNHTHAAPVLESHGVRGTFYLVSHFVGTDVELWFDQAARWFHGSSTLALESLVAAAGGSHSWELGQRPIVRAFMAYLKGLTREARYTALRHMAAHPGTRERRDVDLAMSADDARDLHRKGHEVGAHTATHPLLTQEDAGSLIREITDCKRELESMLSAEVRGFCYPNGDVDDRVALAVKAAGFNNAPTVAPGYNDRSTDQFRLRRLDMNSARFLNNGKHDEALFRAELTLLHKY